MEKDIIIDFKHVTKKYKLYKNDKKRLLGVFSKKVPYREMLAVNDVTFQVERGETVAFFGRNGAGKSTILKMITGVSYPNEGEIHVGGRVSALLELTSGFDLEMTGRENIYLKGQLCGLKDEEIAELEQEIVDFAEIGEYIDQPVRTYSSGMRSRLGFAINVNIRPEILIVDEALSVGDKLFRSKCLEKVNQIIVHDKVTLLFVTHSTSTARQFCSRGIYLANGRLLFDGDIDVAIDLYDNAGRAEKLRRKAKKALIAAEAEAAKTDTEEAWDKVEAAREKLEKARANVRAVKKGELPEIIESRADRLAAKAKKAAEAAKAEEAAEAAPAEEAAEAAKAGPSEEAAAPPDETKQ